MVQSLNCMGQHVLKLAMHKSHQTIIYLVLAVIFILIGWFGRILYTLPRETNKVTEVVSQIKATPLAKYSIENLSKVDFPENNIETGDLISETNDYSTYKYSMQISPDMSGNLKNISGVINIPKGMGSFPIIVMFRGFVSQETYTMGAGTQPSAKVFAKNGYITIAPDFLGYGESDKEAENIFESRFQTWVTAAVTLKSIPTIEKWDGKNIFIWGHSNGGQIALTTLEIMGKDLPTVLWAPVSMRFPASILFYIDEANDGGKYLISEVADFNKIYDAENFSLINYLSMIKAPIQLNQGTFDTAVPYWQSDTLSSKFKEATVSAQYIKYSGADHNMVPRWNEVVENSLNFYNSHKK